MTITPVHITIREATADDAVAVAAVFRAAFEPLRSIYRPTGEAAARQSERFKEGTRLVAEIDGRIVGTVQVACHDRHMHVIGLAVHPDHRRTGVGRRMMEWIVDQAPLFGHNVVALDTIKETGNVAIFEKMGFHVVHENVATWCASESYPVVHEVSMERDGVTRR